MTGVGSRQKRKSLSVTANVPDSIDENQQREQFSIAYVRAVAAVAGYSVDSPSVDHDSIDMGIAARGGSGTYRSPRIELQLKCSSAAEVGEKSIAFPLKIKNYNDLRAKTLVPRILVVVIVPDELDDWLTHTEEELVLRRCGYWISIRCKPDTTSTRSVTVHLPREQLFNPEQLGAMLERISVGDMP